MRPRTKAEQRARDRRDRAARRYKPQEIDLLLIAEAPPAALDRYFYFPDVTEQDSLFRYVARGVLKVEPSRSNKAELLDELRDRGVFLIDLFRDPIAGGRHDEQVPALVRRVGSLRPRRIILIKAPVYDAAFATLREAGLPVVNERVPFPGSGQQRRFEETFARALRGKPPKAAGKEPQERTPARSRHHLRRKSVHQLLRLYREVLAELRSREVIRTNNPPTGEYAEYLVQHLTGGKLATDPSHKSWDVVTPDGTKIQVKSRVVTDPGLRGERQLSPFRSWKFDEAVIVLFDDTFGVRRATRIDHKTLKAASRRTDYVSADRVMAIDRLLDEGEDLTEDLRAVAEGL